MMSSQENGKISLIKIIPKKIQKESIFFLLVKNLRSFVLILFLFSCASFDTSNIASNFQTAYIAAKNAIFGYPDIEIDEALIESIPYASMSIKIGNGPKGLLVLESLSGEEEIWVSADRVYIVIKKGRIVKTFGLLNNLTDFQSSANSFEDFMKKNIKSDQFYSYYSYDKPRLSDLRTHVQMRNLGSEKIQLLRGEKDLFCIQEIIKNTYLGWEVVNKYWVDEEGYVWKSIQNISPKLPEISFEITKKPAI